MNCTYALETTGYYNYLQYNTMYFTIHTLFVQVCDSRTHQAHKDAEELDHVSIRYRVKTSHKRVEDGNQG